MSFELVDLKSSQTIWVPVSETERVYAGQLVQWADDTGGIEALGVANGAYDATDDEVVAGLVLSTNNETKVFHDGTTVANFRGETVAGVTAQADLIARTQLGNGGMYVKGEKMVLVQMAIIDATTRIRGRFYNAAYGTAPTVLTATGGSTDGGVADATTTNAADVAGVANFSTLYCRSGANAGLYRVTSDTSTTDHTNDVGFPYDTAVGDTFIKVFGKQGYARLQFDAASLYINTAAVTTSYWGVFIDKLDLRVAGSEYCEFRFSPQHLGIPTA